MYTTEEKRAFVRKMIADKQAIKECIMNKGDLKKLAQERGIKFATPI